MTGLVVFLAVALGAVPLQASSPVEVEPSGQVGAPPIDEAEGLERLLTTDTLRSLPAPAVVDAYRADPDFQYDRPQAEGPSLWERFWDWLGRTFWQPLAESTSPQVWEWGLLVVAVLALGWGAARLLRAGGVGVFARAEGRAAGAAGPLLDVEDIAAVDLETRLRTALAAGDHREAVRVRYLRLLQALDAAGLIAWRRDKTNRQYVAELGAADRARARPFARATAAFDAVWYGERPVSAALYGRLGPVFDRAQPAAP